MIDILLAQGLYCQMFKALHGRHPLQWEVVFGLALYTGALVVTRPPEAPELKRIHQAAAWLRAGEDIG